MSKPKPFEKVKLVAGLISADRELFGKAEEALVREFGAVDFNSGIIPFAKTDHYRKEMGAGLLRKFMSFRGLIDPSTLSEIKIMTNLIEEKYSHSKKRAVNIDPGYLDLSRVVLATAKDFQHRIPLRDGIYAEVTLGYRKKEKSYLPFEWTYPDFRTAEYIGIFNRIREIFRGQVGDQAS